jgi:hypothetical protein
LPSVEAAALSGVLVRRCTRCGTRSTETTPPRLVFSCERCALVFQTDDLLPKTSQICSDCTEGRPPAGLPDGRVVRATEHEVLSALATRFRFVSAGPLAAYLERLTRQLVRFVEGAPETVRVVLLDEPALRTLALPSGMLLVSTGTLSFLEDESELAFVLAHELAHAASGDAAVRLVRLGFDAVARRQEAPTPDAWAEAALDLIRLGYGRKRERDADARAMQALVGLDYDPESASRLLRRMQAAMDRGDPRVAETAVCHPSPSDRLRRLERTLWSHVGDGRILRVNREVFRRAASREALSNLVTVELPLGSRSGPRETSHAAAEPEAKRRSIGRYVLWTALGLLALAGGLAPPALACSPRSRGVSGDALPGSFRRRAAGDPARSPARTTAGSSTRTRWASSAGRPAGGPGSRGLARRGARYGNVRAIRGSLDRLLAIPGAGPVGSSTATSRGEIRRGSTASSSHAGRDVALLLSLVQQARERSGSLERFFLEGDGEPGAATLEGAMTSFGTRLFGLDARPFHGDGRVPRKSGARWLVPLPEGGSTCKRHCLFLRWMVRPDDGSIAACGAGPASRLVLPLDVISARGAALGGRSAGRPGRWRSRSGVLRALDPGGPTRFGFAMPARDLGLLRSPRRAARRPRGPRVLRQGAGTSRALLTRASCSGSARTVSQGDGRAGGRALRRGRRAQVFVRTRGAGRLARFRAKRSRSSARRSRRPGSRATRSPTRRIS